jgi:hypothetical protein
VLLSVCPLISPHQARDATLRISDVEIELDMESYLPSLAAIDSTHRIMRELFTYICHFG